MAIRVIFSNHLNGVVTVTKKGSIKPQTVFITALEVIGVDSDAIKNVFGVGTMEVYRRYQRWNELHNESKQVYYPVQRTELIGLQGVYTLKRAWEAWMQLPIAEPLNLQAVVDFLRTCKY